MSIWVDENPVDMLVVEDFNEYAGYSLARGRIPMLNSEIVLSNTVLMLLGKDIGDWVTVRYGEHEQQYIITGVAQVMAGFRGMINVDGLTRIQPDFAFTEFSIYLTAGTDIRVFIELVGNAESDVLARIRSVQESIDSVLGSVSSIFSALGYAIMAVVASVVILVLNLIIKTIIVRRKRELGIQKALGFTTMQLMNQISLNLTPSIILGVLIGATGGYISFNPIFTAAMRGMGIVQANLPAPTDWILIVSVGIIALAYAVSMLIAWRIRKISAYSLVTE
jgi:putative ABC transport system permease protein